MMSISLGMVESIRRAHAEQLANFTLPTTHLPQDDIQFVTKEELRGYIEANPRAVRAAWLSLAKRHSSDRPNWDSVFFTLMESSAVYLRKDEKIACAIRSARHHEPIETVMEHIKESQRDIDEIASYLGCTFVQLCEFTKREPDDLPKHCGAYCGAFISNDESFVGIAFKGTTLQAEQRTDFDYVPIAPTEAYVAFDAATHRGFYHGLFGHYSKSELSGRSFASLPEPETPFQWLTEHLKTVHALRTDSHPVHFTGHSLGAAYCTLTFAEFLRRKSEEEPQFRAYGIGDMYSFGSPRVSLQPFADRLESLTPSNGHNHVFRIVNKDDPICTVPPIRKKEFLWYQYVHVDGGWHLQDDGLHRMPTEQAPDGAPVDPLPVPRRVEDIPDHLPKHYYASWLKLTPHS